MFKWNIRNQILSIGLASFVVLTCAIVYFYNFSKDDAQSKSEYLISFANQQLAKEINNSFQNATNTFNDWVKTDIFGISIEFNTTAELATEFDKHLANSPNFLAIALIDNNGTVIEISKSKSLTGNHQSLRGNKLADFNLMNKITEKSAIFLKSSVLDELKASKNSTYCFYYPAINSSGEKNGAVIAYLDWTYIDSFLKTTGNIFIDQGYEQASVHLINSKSNEIVSQYSNVGNTSSSFNNDVTQWSSKASGSGVYIADFEDGEHVIGYATIHPPQIGNNANDNQPIIASIVPEDNILAQLKKELFKIIIFGILGAIFVSLCCYFIAQRISIRISKIADIATTMATGDIECKIDFRANDETGKLANAFTGLSEYLQDMANFADRIAHNDLTLDIHPKSEKDLLGNAFQEMSSNLSAIVANLSDSANQLVSSVTEISTSSEQMSAGADNQAVQVTEISTAIEEMSATIIESANNANEASNVSSNSNKNAIDGGQIVSSTINCMQAISDVVKKTSDSIGKLAKSAEQIGKIISVIDDIADQTNLLALNAAIEAARAGEQGRGFAVVADEVRKLAERTGKATSEITQMIKGVQDETSEAVSAMDEGIVKVEEGRVQTDQAGNALSEIVNMSQQIMGMIQQIAQASNEQSAAADEISKNIDHISNVTKETALGAQQSAKAAENLNVQADGISKIVSKFKVNS